MLSGESVNVELPAQSAAESGADRSRQLERCTTCRVTHCHVDDRTKERRSPQGILRGLVTSLNYIVDKYMRLYTVIRL